MKKEEGAAMVKVNNMNLNLAIKKGVSTIIESKSTIAWFVGTSNSVARYE